MKKSISPVVTVVVILVVVVIVALLWNHFGNGPTTRAGTHPGMNLNIDLKKVDMGAVTKNLQGAKAKQDALRAGSKKQAGE